jgi:hypothetical protein
VPSRISVDDGWSTQKNRGGRFASGGQPRGCTDFGGSHRGFVWSDGLGGIFLGGKRETKGDHLLLSLSHSSSGVQVKEWDVVCRQQTPSVLEVSFQRRARLFEQSFFQKIEKSVKTSCRLGVAQ